MMTLNIRNFGLWFVVGIMVVSVLALGGAFAPAIARRLVLFQMFFGAIGGLCLAWLAKEFQLNAHWLVVPAGAMLLVAGGVNMAWLSHQQFARARRDLAASQKDQIAALNMLEQLATEESDSGENWKAQYEKEKRKYAPTFLDYLAFRVSPLGEWDSPWPLLFWMAELLVGAITGGWVLSRRLRGGGEESASSQ